MAISGGYTNVTGILKGFQGCYWVVAQSLKGFQRRFTGEPGGLRDFMGVPGDLRGVQERSRGFHETSRAYRET